MQLTKHTDFAFRTLIYLAQQEPGQLVQLKFICEFYDISINHLSKVCQSLAKHGYIEAVRGKGGGIRLAKTAEQICLLDVVRDFETVLSPVNCQQPSCTISANCKLQGILAQAMQAFMDCLADYTLADIQAPALQAQVLAFVEQ